MQGGERNQTHIFFQLSPAQRQNIWTPLIAVSNLKVFSPNILIILQIPQGMWSRGDLQSPPPDLGRLRRVRTGDARGGLSTSRLGGARRLPRARGHRDTRAVAQYQQRPGESGSWGEVTAMEESLGQGPESLPLGREGAPEQRWVWPPNRNSQWVRLPARPLPDGCGDSSLGLGTRRTGCRYSRKSGRGQLGTDAPRGPAQDHPCRPSTSRMTEPGPPPWQGQCGAG